MNEAITAEDMIVMTMTMEDDEEDYGALIYRESQLRKAEAAAAAQYGRKF